MRPSTTAIVARNETWTGKARPSLMRRAGPKKSIIFVRSLKMPEGPAGRARVEISPDGLHWVPEGTEIALPSEKNGVTFARIAHFGTWLRLAAELPDKSSNTVLVTLHLKS